MLQSRSRATFRPRSASAPPLRVRWQRRHRTGCDWSRLALDSQSELSLEPVDVTWRGRSSEGRGGGIDACDSFDGDPADDVATGDEGMMLRCAALLSRRPRAADSSPVRSSPIGLDAWDREDARADFHSRRAHPSGGGRAENICSPTNARDGTDAVRQFRGNAILADGRFDGWARVSHAHRHRHRHVTAPLAPRSQGMWLIQTRTRTGALCAGEVRPTSRLAGEMDDCAAWIAPLPYLSQARWPTLLKSQ